MKVLGNSYFEKVYKFTILLTILVLSLYFAGNIIFPFLFALFFSFALLGPSRWLEKMRVHRFLSALLLVVLATAALGALLTFISFEGYQLVYTIEEAATSKRLVFIEDMGDWFLKTTSATLPNEDQALSTLTQKLISSSGSALKAGFSMLQSTFIFLSLVPIYAVLLLTYRGRVRTFLDGTFKKENSKKGRVIIEEIAGMIQSYLTGLLIVIAIVGTLYAIGLSILGVKFALLLSLVTAILIIIPYIGAILGAVLPASVALLTMDVWWYSLVVIAMYIIIQLLEGYVLTPMIVGKNVDLNPLVIILGMVVLGAIGGILALIIAVPLIASLKITLSHIGGLKSFAGLMDQES